MVSEIQQKFIFTGLGKEKLCKKCGEYWPADEEFFFKGNDSDGLHSWCKACVINNKRIQRQSNHRQKLVNSRKFRVETRRRLSKMIVTQGEL